MACTGLGSFLRLELAILSSSASFMDLTMPHKAPLSNGFDFAPRLAASARRRHLGSSALPALHARRMNAAIDVMRRGPSINARLDLSLRTGVRPRQQNEKSDRQHATAGAPSVTSDDHGPFDR